jgi:hypothetical protein
MLKSEDYRRFAQACLEMAGTAEDDKIRAMLIHMAEVWLRLAQQQAAKAEDKETD